MLVPTFTRNGKLAVAVYSSLQWREMSACTSTVGLKFIGNTGIHK